MQFEIETEINYYLFLLLAFWGLAQAERMVISTALFAVGKALLEHVLSAYILGGLFL
jgi:hypothetical protein